MGRRNSSPPRLRSVEGERLRGVGKNAAGLQHTRSHDGGLQKLVEEIKTGEKHTVVLAAMSVTQSEDFPSEDEACVDRTGLLYTDAAHLVIESPP